MMANNNTVLTKSNFQNLPQVPDNQKLKAPEWNQVADFQKSPAQQITGSLIDTNIVIDGTKQFTTTILETTSSRTITANVAGHLKGNHIIQRYNFDIDCTLTLVNFDSDGNNTGSITPISAGTYDFKYLSKASGINLEIDVNTSVTSPLLSGFEVDGFSFPGVNIAIVDGDAGNDTGATVGGSAYKTIEKAALDTNAAFLLNTDGLFLVYIKAFDGEYLPVQATAGLMTYPGIHYYSESKAIVRSTGTESKPFGDITNGEGDYWFHGKGEWYCSDSAIFTNTFAFTFSSKVFISASVVQNVGVVENENILPRPRAKMELYIDTLLTTGNLQGNAAKDMQGGDLKFFDTDFLGGVVMNISFQRHTKVTYNRCKFRLSPAIHNPLTGDFEVFDRAGNSLFTIDMTDTDQSRQSRLVDFTGVADVQSNVDSAVVQDSRGSCVEIGLNGNSFDHKLNFIDCDFFIDQDKGIGFKVVVSTTTDAGNTVIQLVRPRFIDTSGGTTTAITAYKTASQTDPLIFIEKAESNADVFNTSHTTNTDIVIINPLADVADVSNKLDKIDTGDQSIESVVEFKRLPHNNNDANAKKDFTATPTFAFAVDGGAQQMTLTGNVTTFSTSGEVGSSNMDVYLINDGTAGRTVASPTGWTADPSSETPTTAANAINRYQFYTLPNFGTKFFNIHIVKT